MKSNKAENFIKTELLLQERRLFASRIIFITLVYVGTTFWLNSIRADASLWFVWVLIVIQFALYFSIFASSYQRAIVCGLNKNLGLILFIVLALLGRVNDWELVIIPITVVVMLSISMRTKNIPDERTIGLKSTRFQ